MNEQVQEIRYLVGEAWKGEYNSATTYGNANVVQDPTGLSVYRSLKPGNVGHPLTDANWWFCIINLSSIKAESDRIAALNTAIAQDEALRVAAEQLRQQKEAQREAAETQRNEAEQARISAEQQRVSAEQQRASQEQTRISQEQSRVTAEQGRVAAEAQRVQKEQLRENNEAQRVINETNRVAAEAERVAQYAADHQQAVADHDQYVIDNAQLTGLVDRADADHVQAGQDHTRAESDHTQAGNDHTRAESDHSTAAADHTQAGADHTQAGSDHTRAESDHTRAESDHAAVEVYVDSLGVFDLSKHNAVGGVLATYADLSAALTALNALESKYKYGGMSFKFVQSSDNKYVQYRLAASIWSTDIQNWTSEDPYFIDKIMQEVNEAIDEHTPIEITGDVTNAPDEEDLTSVNVGGTDVLKFKDKAYNSLTYSGMGRKILRKNIVDGVNILTQNMINDANTIYFIQYDYVLGEDITVPANCVLEFDGGSLSNGTLTGDNTSILADNNVIFKDVILTGTFACSEASDLWFDNTSDNLVFENLMTIANHSEYKTIIIGKKDYTIVAQQSYHRIIQVPSNTTLVINKDISIAANAFEKYNIIDIKEKENVKVCGTGSITGDALTHTGTTGEAGHCIHIIGSEDVIIEGLKLSYGWGDGISIDSSESRKSNNVIVRYCNISYCRRNNISVEGADNTTIENCIIHHVASTPDGGTLPRAGINVEPWREGNVTTHTKIKNTTFYNNRTAIYVQKKVADVLIDGCEEISEIDGNKTFINIFQPTYDGCNIVMRNCIGFENAHYGDNCNFEADSCTFGNIILLKGNINYTNCIFKQSLCRNATLYHHDIMGDRIIAPDSNSNVKAIFFNCTFLCGGGSLVWKMDNGISADNSIEIMRSSIISTGRINFGAVDIYDSYINGKDIRLRSMIGKTVYFVGNTIKMSASGSDVNNSLFYTASAIATTFEGNVFSFINNYFLTNENIIKNGNVFNYASYKYSNRQIEWKNNLLKGENDYHQATVFSKLKDGKWLVEYRGTGTHVTPTTGSVDYTGLGGYSAGSMYLNTTDKKLKVWDGTQYKTVAFEV